MDYVHGRKVTDFSALMRLELDGNALADEPVAVVEAEAQRVVDRAVHELPRDPSGPVGAAQELVDRAAIEPGAICRDRQAVALPLHRPPTLTRV